MAVRVIKKSLAGSEDLLLGFGTEIQVRNDKNIEITKINASNIPYDETKSISEFVNDTTKDITSITKKVDTIDALRSMTETFDTIWVSGYYTKGDGAFGSNIFEWDSASTEDDNGGTVIKLASVETGRYKLRCSGAVNVKWFGAKGDGLLEDDTDAIQDAIDYCILEKYSLYIPSGTYSTSRPLVITGNGVWDSLITIYGGGKNNTRIVKSGTSTSGLTTMYIPSQHDYLTFDLDAVLIITQSSGYAHNINISDLTLAGDDSANSSKYCLYAPAMAKSQFHRLYLEGCGTGFRTMDSWQCTLSSVDSLGCANGFIWDRIDGLTSGGTGTSLDMINCGCGNITGIAYKFIGLSYSSLTNIANDNCTGNGMYIEGCRTLTINNLATEASAFLDYYIKVSGTSVVSINGMFSYLLSNSGTSLINVASSKLSIVGLAIKTSTSSTTGTLPITASSSSDVTITNSRFDIDEITGAKASVDYSSNIKINDSKYVKNIDTNGNYSYNANTDYETKYLFSSISVASTATQICYIDIPKSAYAGGLSIEINGLMLGSNTPFVLDNKHMCTAYRTTGLVYNIETVYSNNSHAKASEIYNITASHSVVGSSNRLVISVIGLDSYTGICDFTIKIKGYKGWFYAIK